MLLFIDESGHDRREAPYEVLAGVAVSEQNLWNLIQAIRAAELEHFGLHLSDVGVEFKGRKLLKRKTFQQANRPLSVSKEEKRTLTRACLMKGWRQKNGEPPEPPRGQELVAYRHTILEFIKQVFEIAARFRVKTFAAMVDKNAPRAANPDFLRKDYAFLFQRFFYYLEDYSSNEMGLIVFDELEKAKSRILITQLEKYYLETERGYARSSRIVPEPFFVHSDLTTMVQLSDIVAYCLNWGLRIKTMTEPIRPEIKPFGEMAFDLRYVGTRPDSDPQKEDVQWPVYGIFHLDDLRPKYERE